MKMIAALLVALSVVGCSQKAEDSKAEPVIENNSWYNLKYQFEVSNNDMNITATVSNIDSTVDSNFVFYCTRDDRVKFYVEFPTTSKDVVIDGRVGVQSLDCTVEDSTSFWKTFIDKIDE